MMKKIQRAKTPEEIATCVNWHREIGRRLIAVVDELGNICVEIGARYPGMVVMNYLWARQLAVTKAIGKLRSYMDARACEELRDEPNSVVLPLYYPKAKP